MNKGYDILDYIIIPDGYCCIAREIQSDNNFNSFCLYHVNNTDKKFVIPKNSGRLSIAGNGVFFLSDYFSTANSFALSYLDFGSASINDIKQDITDYCIRDNTIYFINDNDLYEKNLSTEAENLIINSCSQIIKANEYFAFIKTDSGIYKYYFDTKSIEQYYGKNNYKLIAAISIDSVVITKQGNSSEHDELEYNIFRDKLKPKYYILSDNKLIHLKILDGYHIENAIYYDENLEE